MKFSSRVNTGALIAGVTSFVVLYIALTLALVFALSLLSERFDSVWIEHAFKLFGLLALLFPGYAAARIAGRNGLLHGLLTGILCSVISAAFLMLTFSWEGSYRHEVWLGIIKIAILGCALGSLGGFLGERRNRNNRKEQHPLTGSR